MLLDNDNDSVLLDIGVTVPVRRRHVTCPPYCPPMISENWLYLQVLIIKPHPLETVISL